MNFLVKTILILLPLHAFLVSSIAWSPLSFWKELLLVIILLGTLGMNFKKIWENLKSDKLIWLILLYLVFASLSVFWAQDTSLTRLIYGFKYELMIFAVLLIGMSFGASSTYSKFNDYLKYFYYGGSLAIVIGLIVHFILGPESLTWFGYSSEWSTYTPGKALSFCHKIENTEICRFQGTFAGPNQAAFYILMYLPISIYYTYQEWQDKSKYLYIYAGLSALALISLYFTYSRSAWLGLLSMGGAFFLLKYKIFFQKKNILIYLSGLAIIVVLLLWQMGDLYEQIILRMNSTNEHIAKWLEGFKEFQKHPWFGSGLASVGPGARRLIDFPLIPESWFLQVAVNTGLIGLSLFASIYSWLIFRLWLIKDSLATSFLLILLSLLLPMQVLHVFEDSSLSYSLFLLVGIYLGSQKTSQNIKTE